MSGTSHRDGGAPRGPADAVSYGDREPIAIAGWLFPGGGEVRAPVVSDPFWRGLDGRRLQLLEVFAGQKPELQAQLLAAHASAIAEVVRAAAEAKAAGVPGTVAPIVAAASRLCHELIGQG